MRPEQSLVVARDEYLLSRDAAIAENAKKYVAGSFDSQVSKRCNSVSTRSTNRVKRRRSSDVSSLALRSRPQCSITLRSLLIRNDLTPGIWIRPEMRVSCEGRTLVEKFDIAWLTEVSLKSFVFEGSQRCKSRLPSLLRSPSWVWPKRSPSSACQPREPPS